MIYFNPVYLTQVYLEGTLRGLSEFDPPQITLVKPNPREAALRGHRIEQFTQ